MTFQKPIYDEEDGTQVDTESIRKWIDNNKNRFSKDMLKVIEINKQIETISNFDEAKDILSKKLYRTVMKKFESGELSKKKEIIKEKVSSSNNLTFNTSDSSNSYDTEDSKDKKGRFLIEEVTKKCLQSEHSQMGRFKVLSEGEAPKDEDKINLAVIKAFEKQQEQIDMLFGMMQKFVKKEEGGEGKEVVAFENGAKEQNNLTKKVDKNKEDLL